MLEKDIQKRVITYARSKRMLCYKMDATNAIGVCDILVINDGRAWFIEFKQKGKKPTPMQARHHQLLISHGMTVYVVDSVEQGKEIVDHELEQKGKRPHRDAVQPLDCPE